MYAMYPDWSGTEWGPAKHDPEHPFRRDGARGRNALQAAFGAGNGAALDLRDADENRPDDN
ncbi:hypothetical protein FXB39_07055 [Nocardioides sp. BGMRC 2183]|jgi:hypothetical protein|nr:hypothetical protein FXB39_07055 [Nocardioides sp. BGMRC 2183]